MKLFAKVYKDIHKFSPSAVQCQDLYFTSKALVKVLRHQIGQKWGNSIPCNGGGWVDMDHVLNRVPAGTVQEERQIPNDR